jgi:hypothetical protein
MDIRLGKDGDAVFINGPLSLEGVTHFAQDVVAQRLVIRLKTFLGEWFIDTTYGLPYFERILTKNVSKTTVDNILRENIFDEPGVLEIQKFTSEFNAAARTYSCSFTVLTREGAASVEVTV